MIHTHSLHSVGKTQNFSILKQVVHNRTMGIYKVSIVGTEPWDFIRLM
jgi:hypothetical protein